jgi:hypothetical protein
MAFWAQSRRISSVREELLLQEQNLMPFVYSDELGFASPNSLVNLIDLELRFSPNLI